MSDKHIISKEEAINQLYTTIKTRFEDDGVLQEVRCLLQSKMVAMMRGKSEMNPLVQRANRGLGSGDGSMDSRLALLNQLIMEYFHWHGFHYSAEMFAMESGSESSNPLRECLEGVLGAFEHKALPILLQVVAELQEKHSNSKNVNNTNTATATTSTTNNNNNNNK